MLLKFRSTGYHVKTLQVYINTIYKEANIKLDAIFGQQVLKWVKKYQYDNNLIVDGIVGNTTFKSIEKSYLAIKLMDKKKLIGFRKNRFVVFVDAGHGGINDRGEYVTPGKRAYHNNEDLHYNGWYYEGYENRVIAEAFIEACTEKGIMCVRTYHPYEDWPLAKRAQIVRSWLKRGYIGYLHSFHSNAISSSNTAYKLENTTGFAVFNTKGDNFSDRIATQHFEHVSSEFALDWKQLSQTNDKDPDFEANFQILRETDLKEFTQFGAILDEWGFHTSKKDALFITDPKNRDRRVDVCLKTALWVKENI